jgi:hypothetical protein
MTPASPQSNVRAVEHVLLWTLGQVAIIIAAARVAGNLARRIGQPRASCLATRHWARCSSGSGRVNLAFSSGRYEILP